MKLFRELYPEITRIEESPLKSSGSTVGWHVSAIDANGVALGGGLSESRHVANRVAIAECIERKAVCKLMRSDLREDFLLDEFPTSCGFAAGFDSDKCRFRAISEAVERWAWSKWIDEGFHIPKVSISKTDLSPLENYFYSKFESVDFYSLNICTNLIQNFFFSVRLDIALAFKDDGVFPGSRVSIKGKTDWSHPLIEAWRHLHIFKNQTGVVGSQFPISRITFFGNHRELALEQVLSAKQTSWPKPEAKLIKEVNLSDAGIFVWRSLMKNYLGWEKNGVARFVY